MIAVLMDPDKASKEAIVKLAEHPAFQSVDFVFVGGSLVTEGQMSVCLESLKEHTNKPLIIFPGNPNQIDSQADSILLLSLISGRNPDLLIGKHVESAQQLKKSGLEVIPTSYILIDGGKTTTVSYISNTIPIPQDKPDIASSTALAGELLGYKLCYMDCGSGAKWPVHPDLIKKVKQEINVPLIIGGGIRTKNQAEAIFKAGADIVVVGNKLEEDPQFLEDLVLAKHQFNSASVQTP
ncbi:MAG: geranylgeranylglyceryl/heptaprenylglyceryl phosphate synthase [Bacteroidia bacterium]